MADDSRYRSFRVPGLGAQGASAVLVEVLRERPGLHVHEIGPGRLSVSRTGRPRWALALCAATFWLGGLGFLFLLVKHTEAGEVVVTDGPRGSVVAVPPLLAGAARDLEAALWAPTPSAPTPPASTPVAPTTPASSDEGPADELEGRTVARRDLAPPAPVPGGGLAAPVRLVFADGVVDVAPGTSLVLGRDPSPTSTAAGRTVPGDPSTVSKSHLLVHHDGTTVTVEDLGSTNGSTLERDGSRLAMAPGEPVAVAPGDRVVLGAVAFTLGHVEAASGVAP